MFNNVKKFLRKRALKKNASTVATQILPLSSVKTMAAIIDVEDTSFNTCKEAILSFCRDKHIRCEIFFFDFRKIGNEERLFTSITNTILEKDVNWYGRPSVEKMELLFSFNPDMLLSLIKGEDFPIEYMASCCRARFKIGRSQLPGDVFDFIVSDSQNRECSQLDVFEGIRKYLNVIAE